MLGHSGYKLQKMSHITKRMLCVYCGGADSSKRYRKALVFLSGKALVGFCLLRFYCWCISVDKRRDFLLESDWKICFSWSVSFALLLLQTAVKIGSATAAAVNPSALEVGRSQMVLTFQFSSKDSYRPEQRREEEESRENCFIQTMQRIAGHTKSKRTNNDRKAWWGTKRFFSRHLSIARTRLKNQWIIIKVTRKQHFILFVSCQFWTE